MKFAEIVVAAAGTIGAAAAAFQAAHAAAAAPIPPPSFALSFDDGLKAATASGNGSPLLAEGVAFGEGVKGRSGVFSSSAAPRLEFPLRGNLDIERGTILMWVRRHWPPIEEKKWRTMFILPGVGISDSERIGSGQLWFWWNAHRLRCDLGDDDDTHVEKAMIADDDWHLLAFSWDEGGAKLYVDGKRAGSRRMPGSSPIPEARRTPGRITFAKRHTFERFAIGSNGNEETADCEIDELRIWTKPLAPEAISALYERERKGCASNVAPDWVALMAATGANPYEAALSTNLPPGVPALELIEEVHFDSETTLAALVASNRFAIVGEHSFGDCGGEPYVELGLREFDRFALRFQLEDSAPLHCLEIDYPDNAFRTMGFIVQGAGETKWDGARCADYTMQVGVATGGEYPCTGRMLTHRCLCWTRTNDVALVAMTERDCAPAAIARVRLYKVPDAKLPAADAANAPHHVLSDHTVQGGSAHRHFALYYEDPAIEYDFAAGWDTPDGFSKIIDRTAALMKFTGQDMLAYPGAWYGGLIGDDYNPREHPRNFLTAWYGKFDREGLSIVPTINIHDMPLPDGTLTRMALESGALHSSALSIHADGTPGNGGTHNQLAGFNFFHPDVRRMLENTVDALVEQGARHPSFKGVCLFLTRYNMLWFGDGEAGYNDYCIDAFRRETGVAVPEGGEDPLRGKTYHDWLRANAWEEWLDWRCREVARFWAAIGRRMASRRPDLKLWVNSFVPPKPDWPDFMDPEIISRRNREAGLDAALLESLAPNIVISQTQVPIGSRFWRRDRYPALEAQERQRHLWRDEAAWRLLDNAAYPWIHIHDLYFEDLGRAVKSRPLAAPWLKECLWQVVTVNPSGRNALRPFAEPLKWHDVLGFSKGGFLVGTYGMEDVLVPFIRAFKALPPVVMREVKREGAVIVREAEYQGKSYLYAVNTSDIPAEITLPVRFDVEDLVTGQSRAPGEAIRLDAWELKSFSEQRNLQ